MVSATPKFKSAEFKAALASLKTVFDAHSMSVILVDALDRRAAEQVFKKFARGEMGRRIQNIKKTELVGQLTSGFFSSDEVAFQLLRELDRASQKERHIVASIPEAQASDRIGSYRAIALKRERAKFVWALARDDRSSVRDLANRIIKEFFSEAADLEVTKAALEGRADATDVRSVDFARRLTDQAARLDEASVRLSALESQVTKHESDRAKLLAQIGAKERALKEETQAREVLEGQLGGLREALGRLESEQAEVVAAREGEDRARARAEELAQKVRRLSKLSSAADRLADAQAKAAELERSNEELSRQISKLESELNEARQSAEADREKQVAQVEGLREQLKQARKQLADAEDRAVAEAREGQDGMLVLLDQANLAASAHAVYRRKVNFAALLNTLSAGRKARRAVAFVVDNGGAQFEAFCDTLRRAGWELRLKKPKHFKNGRTKADWDMGIAVEAVEQADKMDTVVLVSGDGDFVPLIRLLKRRGLRVEIAAFPEALASELYEAADVVTTLDAGTLE